MHACQSFPERVTASVISATVDHKQSFFCIFCDRWITQMELLVVTG